MNSKITLAFSLLAFVVCGSCNQSDPSTPQNTPKALQDSHSASDYISRETRGYEDLVDELFEEIQANRPEVKEAVESQQKMLQRITDIQTQLHANDGKSERYYASARTHLQAIADSVFRARVASKVADSEQRWRASLAARDARSAELSRYTQKLTASLEALKIRLTLPQIEDFQRSHQPDQNLTKGLKEDHERLLKQIEGLQPQ